MRVLITGSNSALGSALQRLAPSWADINAIDVEDCDLSDLPMLRARLTVEASDLIINTASFSDIDSAESNPDMARTVNIDAVATMVEALRDTGGKMVQLSTALVFDGKMARAYLPDDERNPLSVFGRTKAEGEDALRPQDLLIRTGWVYGASDNSWVMAMMRQMDKPGGLTAVADQFGAPTRASGVARTIWGLVERNASGIYHHCDAGSASPHEFAVAVAEDALELGLITRTPMVKPISAADDLTFAPRPDFSVLDCHTTRSALGDEAVSWRENLRSVLLEEAGFD